MVHARSVGIENPRDLDGQSVLTVIVEKQSFGTALAFVITGPRSDRVDMAPVLFRLRMHLRIAIDLAGRGLENLATQAFGQPQHVDGPVH